MTVKEKHMKTGNQQYDSTIDNGQASMPSQMGDDLVGSPYIDSLPGDAIHAKELIGSNVESRLENENIGSINDLIVDRSGQVTAVIVGVGGFLGIGERDVAIAWHELEHSLDNGKPVLHIDADKDVLKGYPEYRRN